MPPTPAFTRHPDSFIATVPRLATARLVLREPRHADFERFAANAADPLARQHIRGVLARRDAWRQFLALSGTWPLHGTGWWVVEEPELGALGTVGVFQRDDATSLEIGWSIDRPHWGKGYACEAARAALAFAADGPRGDRIIAYVGVGNAASNAVAAKIGMKREAEVDFYDSKHWLYAWTP
jgi:RimJ/RimL family protein N-acetyltransferase